MRTINIPKRSGGTRTIYVQSRRESRRYRLIAHELMDLLLAHDCSHLHGFMPGRSPVTNAMAHAGHRFVLQMDLRDFFDHCTFERLLAAGVPRYLGARACVDGAARQGLSSSPAASNLAALPLDRDLMGACPAGVTYTRYADDITFSGDDLGELLTIRSLVPSLAEQHGQEVNGKKTRIQRADTGRAIITGVAVDSEGVHLPRRTRRTLRAARHNLERLQNKLAVLGPGVIPAMGRVRELGHRTRGLEEWAKLKPPRSSSPSLNSRIHRAWIAEQTKKMFAP